MSLKPPTYGGKTPSANEVVQKLKLMGNAGNGLFMIDRELAQRVFTMPTTTKEGGSE